MEEKRRIARLGERACRLLDLPLELLSSLPRCTLNGNMELLVEHHRGILGYGEEEILVGGGPFCLCVRGQGLRLRSMTEQELFITGTITALEVRAGKEAP